MCDVCPKSRQFKLPFPISQVRTKCIFDLIHINTWKSYKVFIYNNYRYFLTIVDDCSRGTWTYLLTTKNNAFSILQCFLQMVERQFSTKVEIISSDNALELSKSITVTNFFNSEGIIHQTACVATPQKNGIVERKHKRLLEITRALLLQFQVLLVCWGECILTATYLINRLPSRVLHEQTPYDVLFGMSPSNQYFKCFRLLFYASTLAHDRGRFLPRAKACVFLGYPNNQKGYKL